MKNFDISFNAILRLALPVFFLITLGFGVSLVLSSSSSRSILEKHLFEANKKTLFLAKNYVSHWLKEKELFFSDSFLLTLKKSLQDQTFESKNVKERFAKISAKSLDSVSIGLLNHDFKVIHEGQKGPSLLDEVKTSICRNSFETQVARVKSHVYVVLCKPIFDKGRLLGVAFGVFNLKSFYDRELLSLFNKETEFLYILDSRGLALLAPIGYDIGSWRLEDSFHLSEQKIGLSSFGVMQVRDEKNTVRLDAFTVLEKFDWVVVASTPRENLHAASYADLKIHFLFVVFIGLACGLLVFLVVKWQYLEPQLTLKDYALLKAKDLSTANDVIEFKNNAKGHEFFKSIKVLEEAFMQKIQKIKEQNEKLDLRVRERTHELEKASGAIVAQAHQAGMAEIATGALHNIGNGLVPIKSSLYLLRDVADKLPVARFLEVNLLLKENKDNLAEFLANDTRGAKLPEYYGLLGSAMADGCKQIKEHIIEMQESLLHVSSVISGQQKYAKAGDLNESVDLLELLESVLKMYSQRINAAKISTNLNTSSHLPQILVSRHKCIQIVMNIVKNAVDAMEPLEGNHIIRFSFKSDGGYLQLIIEDSGPGILEADLKKIFSHGFTTKKDGHGFGLHSCANMMREMGGDILVDNSSLGGAMFVLKFPLQQSEKSAG